MRRKRPHVPPLAGVGSAMWAVALVAASCGGGGGDGDVTSGGFSVEGAIAQIPATVLDAGGPNGTAQVAVADLAGASESMGLVRPSDDTDADLVVNWLIELGGTRDDGGPAEIFVPRFELIGTDLVRNYDAYVAELGFGVAAMDTIAEFNAPPNRFTAVTGDGSFPEGLPEVAPGVRTIGEGDDLEIDVDAERTALRPLMRPVRVAERDGVLVASLTTPSVEAWLAASGPSLAETEPFASVARALDDVGVVTAYLHRGEISSVSAPSDDSAAIGLGWAIDDGGPLGVIVFRFESEGVAADNLEAITDRFDGNSVVTDEPISDLMTLEVIETSGSSVVARVRFPDDSRPSVVYEQFVRLDSPFVEP